MITTQINFATSIGLEAIRTDVLVEIFESRHDLIEKIKEEIALISCEIARRFGT